MKFNNNSKNKSIELFKVKNVDLNNSENLCIDTGYGRLRELLSLIPKGKFDNYSQKYSTNNSLVSSRDKPNSIKLNYYFGFCVFDNQIAIWYEIENNNQLSNEWYDSIIFNLDKGVCDEFNFDCLRECLPTIEIISFLYNLTNFIVGSVNFRNNFCDAKIEAIMTTSQRQSPKKSNTKAMEKTQTQTKNTNGKVIQRRRFK